MATRRTKLPGLPAAKVEIDAMLLANGVEVREGMLYVLGGGWMRCWPSPGQPFPYDKQVQVCLLLRVPYHETNMDHTFAVALRDSDEQPIAPGANGNFRVGREVALTDGMSQLVPIAFQQVVKIAAPGIYYVVVEIDGEERKRIAFEALTMAPR